MKKLKLITAILLLIVLLPFAFADTILEFSFEISNQGRLISSSVDVKDGRTSIGNQNNGEYNVRITDKNKELIWSDSYKIDFVVYSDPPSFSESSTIFDRIPYTKNMALIELYYQDMLLYQKELKFCDSNRACDGEENIWSCPEDCSKNGQRLCGDNLCNNFETPNSCTGDCKSGSADGYCDGIADGICDVDCRKEDDKDCTAIPKSETVEPLPQEPGSEIKETKQETKENKSKLALIIAASFLLLAVLAFFTYYYLKKEEPKENPEQKSQADEQVKKSLRTAGWSEEEIEHSTKKP